MTKTERFECGDVVIAPPGEMCGRVVRVARHESHRRLDRITVRWENGHEGVRAAQSLQRADTRLRRRTVTINGNWRCEETTEWAGTATLQRYGDLECTAEIPEEVYSAIEDAIAGGDTEGCVSDDSGERSAWRVRWEWCID
jgi:hypothetical protein